MKTFEELECYKLGRELRKAVSTFCKTLPREEEYRLKDQPEKKNTDSKIKSFVHLDLLLPISLRVMVGITTKRTHSFVELLVAH